MKKKKFYFRLNFDKGNSWGFGHLSRSLSLLKEINKNKKLQTVLILNETNFTKNYSNKFLKKFNVIFIKKEKLLNYCKILESNSIICFDTLGTKKSIVDGLKKKLKIKIISLEDISKGSLYCDLVLNSKIYLNKKKYINKKIFNNLNYMIIKKDFKKRKFLKFKPQKKINLLIASGGSDYKNILYKFSIELLKIKKLRISALIGPGVDKKNKIFKLSNKINLVINPKSVKKLITRNDIIMTSGGTFMFESLSFGKIVLAYENYHHQKNIINYLKNKRALIKLPKSMRNMKIFIEKLFLDIKINPESYFAMQRRAYKLIDNKGLDRSINLIKKKLKI